MTQEVAWAKSMPATVTVVLCLEPRTFACKLRTPIAVPKVCSESWVLQF